jgi:hypothetical protein
MEAHVRNILGPEYVGVVGSGAASIPLFLERRGKKKKPRRDVDTDYKGRDDQKKNYPRRRPPRKAAAQPPALDPSSSSGGDTGRSYAVQDILFDATDEKGHRWCLTRFEGYLESDLHWVAEKDLSPDASEWWLREREKRFPSLDGHDLLFYGRDTLHLPEAVDIAHLDNKYDHEYDGGALNIHEIKEIVHGDDPSSSSSDPSPERKVLLPDSADIAIPVVKVTAERGTKRRKEYLLVWDQYSSDECEWVPADKLDPAVIEAWQLKRVKISKL